MFATQWIRRRELAQPIRGWRLARTAFAALLLGIAPGRAAADVIGTIEIDDLTEGPITVKFTGGTTGTGTATPDPNNPERVTFSFDVDGRITDGTTGVAVLFDFNGVTISDILEVTLRQNQPRGGGPNQPKIDYFTASGKFISDSDNPSGLNLADFYNLNDDVMKAILAMGQIENGKFQDLGSRLIDIGTDKGDPLGIAQLEIKAASDAPEPSSQWIFALALIALGASRRRIARARTG